MVQRLQSLLPISNKTNNKQDTFNTEFFLESVAFKIIDSKNFSQEELQVLNRLCKKIDVVKKVYTHYQLNLAQASSQQVLQSNYAEILCIILLHTAQVQHNYKFFNSALKLLEYYSLEQHYEHEINTLLHSIEIES